MEAHPCYQLSPKSPIRYVVNESFQSDSPVERPKNNKHFSSPTQARYVVSESFDGDSPEKQAESNKQLYVTSSTPTCYVVNESFEGGAPESDTATSAFKNFADATVPQISGSANIFFTIFWTTAYICLTGVFIYQMVLLTLQYLAYKTDTSLTLERSSEATFPMLTLCNNNPVKKQMLEKVRRYSDLALLDDYVESEMVADLEADFGLNLSYKCDWDDWTCPESKVCIPYDWICDGKVNCPDGEDEGEITSNGTTVDCDTWMNPYSDWTYDAFNTDRYCADGFVTCNDTDEPVCARPCDGKAECSNGFDEMAEIGCIIVRECGRDVNLTVENMFFPQWIYSPNFEFEAPYDNNKECYWVVTAPPGHSISAEFLFLDVEEDSNGQCVDYVSFFEGNDSTGLSLSLNGRKRICGRHRDTTIGMVNSTSNQMYIKFKTNRSVAWLGFGIDLWAQNQTEMNRRVRRDKSVISDQKRRRIRNALKRSKRSETRSRQGRSTYSDYNNDINYDDRFWENYEAWYDNYDPFANFDQNLKPFDWMSAYEQAKRPDYSDLRSFALFSQKEVRSYGTKAIDFIAQCTFDGRDCDWEAFEVHQNPQFGNCFLFNTILNQRQKSDGSFYGVRSTSKTGKENGLKLNLFVDADEYIGLLSQNVGAQILLTTATGFPLPESDGTFLSVGFNTKIGVRQEKINRQGGKYGNCHSKWPQDIDFAPSFLERWPFYSEKVCEVYCIQRHIFTNCMCTDSYLVGFNANEDDGDNIMCNYWNATQRNCIRDVYKKYRDEELYCPCHSPCDSDLYHSTSSSVEWPSVQFAPYFVQLLRKSSPSDVIQDYLEALLNTDEVSDPKWVAFELRKQFLRVEVFFQELNFQRLKESPKYTMVNLLSDFGGNIGLWIGWSVMTSLEIFVLLFNLLKLKATGRTC